MPSPRYDLETAQKGAGTAMDPLIPQNPEQMRRFADEAARRVQSVSTINIVVDGHSGRLMDLYRDDGGRIMALVKLYDPMSGIYIRVVPVTNDMVGLDEDANMFQELMPLIAPKNFIPARLLHRDPKRITGQIMDVFVNSNDPLHLMTITKTDNTEAGLAIQKLMPGGEGNYVMAGRSIEVDPVPGVDWSDPNVPKGYLTGIIPTPFPKMAESRQEVEIHEEMGAKGGSNYSLSTPLSNMKTVEINDAQAAVAVAQDQTLDSGVEEHGIPAPKRTKNLEGRTQVEADFQAEVDEQIKLRRDAEAKLTVLRLQKQLAEYERTTGVNFDDLAKQIAESAEDDRSKEAVKIATALYNEDDGVKDMVLENPEGVAQAVGDYSWMAKSIHRSMLQEEEAKVAAKQAIAEEEAATESRRLALLDQARSKRANYSHGSSSIAFNMPRSSVPAAPSTPTPPPPSSSYKTDRAAFIAGKIQPYTLIKSGGNYGVTGGTAFSDKSIRLAKLMDTLYEAGCTDTQIMGFRSKPMVVTQSSNKRGRED